jgi:hypothetical protein
MCLKAVPHWDICYWLGSRASELYFIRDARAQWVGWPDGLGRAQALREKRVRVAGGVLLLGFRLRRVRLLAFDFDRLPVLKKLEHLQRHDKPTCPCRCRAVCSARKDANRRVSKSVLRRPRSSMPADRDGRKVTCHHL